MPSTLRSIRSITLAVVVASLAPLASAQLSTTRLLPGDDALAPAAGDQRHAAIARGNGQSLMVWEDWRAQLTGTVGNGAAPDLFAARIDDNGNLLDTTPIVVRSGSFAQLEPRVAWNGSQYLVVWTEPVPHAFNVDKAVFAARVTTAGQVLDDPPMLLEDQTYVDELGAVVASNGTDWAVMWSALTIRGCTISAAGVANAPQTLMSSSIGFYFPVNIELASSGGRYMLVCEHFPVGGSFNDAFAQLFDANLVKLGGEIDLGPGAGFGTNAQVAGNGSGFCAVWSSPLGMRATPISAGGAPAVPGGADISGALYTWYQSPAVAWDGSNWLLAFNSSSGLNYATNIVRMSPGGALLAPAPTVVEQGAWQMERPACAATASGALVVWTDARNSQSIYSADRLDLFASRVSPSGAPSPSACLSVGPPAQLDPAIAGDLAHGYLVAFRSLTQATGAIAVQRVNSAGAALDPQPRVLASGIRVQQRPAIAWNGSMWIVAWSESGAGPFGSFPTVYATRVAADGTPLDVAPIPVMPGGEPELAAIGDEFLVVASHEPINHQRYVYTRRLRGSDGALLDAAPIQRTISFDFAPTVAAFSDHWLIVWAHLVTHDGPYATLRSLEVSLIGQATTAVVIGDAGASNAEPTLAVDGTQALLAWRSNGDVFGRRIPASGIPIDAVAGFAISAANNVQSTPSAAWDGANFTVAFEDDRAHVNPLDITLGDVYASRVSAAAQVLDPLGLAVASDARQPEAQPSVAGDSGAAVLAFTSLHSAAPHSTWRISVRATCPPVATYCTAKTNSLGCVPAIGFSGAPQLGAPSGFVITGSNVRNNTFGLLLYGIDGPSAVPFHGGVLCVRHPAMRTPVRNSGGSPTGLDCSGVFALDFNAFASGLAGGSPNPALAQATTIVDCQWWSRDNGFAAPNNVSLTDGLQFSFCH